MSDDQQFILGLLEHISWPIISIIVLFMFRGAVFSFIKRTKSLKIKVPNGGTVELEASEATAIVEGVLEGIDELIIDMGEDEKVLIKKLSLLNTPPKVEEIFPDFKRSKKESQSKDHVTLGVLRKRHLVRPVEGSTWRSHKHIEITPFGKLVLKLRYKEVTTHD